MHHCQKSPDSFPLLSSPESTVIEVFLVSVFHACPRFSFVVGQYKMQTADCRLQTADRVQNADLVQNADCRLQTGYKMQTDI